jgi:hypothetical protein
MKKIATIAWCGVLAVGPIAAEQRRVTGADARKTTVGVTASLKAAGESYDLSGPARCTHAPMAAIYGIVSEQWTVEQSEGTRSLNLTLWKPKNGSGEMFTFSVSPGRRAHSVNTVKAGNAPAPSGSGTVKLAPAGSGGTFTIDAKTADGAAITGTVKCDEFLAAVAEGGN